MSERDETWVVCIDGYGKDKTGAKWETLRELHFDNGDDAYHFFDFDLDKFIKTHYGNSGYESISAAAYDLSYSDEFLEEEMYYERDLNGEVQ